jgi:vacuolar iron transporter family protein
LEQVKESQPSDLELASNLNLADAESSLSSWREEQRSAYLYRLVAAVETGTARADLFNELAGEADKQAKIWADNVRLKGGRLPDGYKPDVRTRAVGVLLRRLGVRPLCAVLSAMKVRGMSLYTQPDNAEHAVPINLADVGRRHHTKGGANNLRAAVFGVNDGLVSNASLIMGIAGAAASGQTILLAGVAGLAAGAFSMAAGEYISVRSQREVFEYQIDLERAELETYPDAEAAELALIYEAKGISKEEAQRLANALILDPKKALDTLAREELGLNPDELGSPWGAALASFFAFAAGATIPLLPFVFLGGNSALIAAIIFTLLSLFGVGAALSLFTGRHALRSGLRMMLLGGVAGMATFAIGRMVGVSV